MALIAVLMEIAALFGAALRMRALHHWVPAQLSLGIDTAPASHAPAIRGRLEPVGR